MSRRMGLVVPKGLDAELRELGFSGKKPIDVVSQAVHFAKEIQNSQALATKNPSYVTSEAANNRLNQLRPVLDRLAMAQPVTANVGSLLVRSKLIPPGKSITFADAVDIVNRHLGPLSEDLTRAGLVTGIKEGSFCLEFDKTALQRLRKEDSVYSATVLDRIRRVRELSLANKQLLKESSISVGLMERTRQKNPHRPRRA